LFGPSQKGTICSRDLLVNEISNNGKQEYKHLSKVNEHGLGKQKGNRRNEKERGRGEKEVGESKRR
jgi:hypothetical protein